MQTDVFIIGGGINGASIAADAASRGLSVVLCEKNDLASGTSSASTKLIHGGLRYLEQYEFSLVRHALQERTILMQRAPHLIRPLEFILPHETHLRPAWMIRLGLFLYDHLARHSLLPNSKKVKLINSALKPEFKTGFSYYDCATDDARLTVLNAIAAQEYGATILTRHQFVSAHYTNQWEIQLQNQKSYTSQILINASGPWVLETQKNIHVINPFSVELIKGSHILIPKLYAEKTAYLLQNKDKRVVFTIPYEENFTLIGTTDVPFSSDLDHINASEDEKKYLCDTVNHYFKKSISLNDICWFYSGVRCLQASSEDNPSEITRDYKLLLHKDAPLLTVIGGKITTHRQLAVDVLHKLQLYFPHMKNCITSQTPLPGGDIPNADFLAFYEKFKTLYAWLPENIAWRYAKNYGTRAHIILRNTHSLADLGEDFSNGMYQKEITYLIQHEWAKTADDILWRRTKMGLFFSAEDYEKLERWLVEYFSK